MRPVSIVRFEQAYLASVLLWAVNLAMGWNIRIAAIEQNAAFSGNPQMLELAQTVMLGMSAFFLLLWLLLWYFTARRASNVAKWIIVALLGISAIGLPLALMSAPTSGLLSLGLTVLGFVLNACAVWMLFRPDAKLWFAGN